MPVILQESLFKDHYFASGIGSGIAKRFKDLTLLRFSLWIFSTWSRLFQMNRNLNVGLVSFFTLLSIAIRSSIAEDEGKQSCCLSHTYTHIHTHTHILQILQIHSNYSVNILSVSQATKGRNVMWKHDFLNP